MLSKILIWLILLGNLAGAQPLLDVEQDIWRFSNQARVSHKLAALSLDPVLSEIARGHSQEMLSQNFFSHGSRDHLCQSVAGRLRQGYRFCLTSAENLYKCQGYSRSELAQAAVEDWLNSPPHARNLLNAQYTRVGIGVAVKGDLALFTQVFTYEPILIESLDVTPQEQGYLVKVRALVSDGPRSGSWFVDGKRLQNWSAGTDGVFSSQIFLSQAGVLDIGQADGRCDWSVETSIPIPPPVMHFRHP